MARRNAATAADARILSFDGGSVKRLRDRQVWLRALLDADGAAMVAHLDKGRRLSKATLIAAAAAIEVYACGGEGFFFASVKTLANAIGSSSTTARAALQVLERAGWIAGERRAKPGRRDSDTTRYRLLPPPVVGGGATATGEGYSGGTSLGTPATEAERKNQSENESAHPREGAFSERHRRAIAWKDTLEPAEWARLASDHAKGQNGYRTPSNPDLWLDAWAAAGCPDPFTADEGETR